MSDYKKLAIVVPTANRETTIEQWLFELCDDAKRYDVDLIVYDSSSNDKTECVVSNYVLDGYENIKYVRYDGEFDGFSLDHKLINAYQQFSAYYEYIWLIRDGHIPCLKDFYDQLNTFMEQRYECIIVDAEYRNFYQSKKVIYSEKKDCIRLLVDQIWRMQTLGMLIFSSKFALRLIDQVPLTEDVYSLWQMAAPFHLFAKNPYKIVFYVGRTFTHNIKVFGGHFWQSGEKHFMQWAYRWCHVIDRLPMEYDRAKSEVYKMYTCDFHAFIPKTILELRVYGTMNIKMIKKYKKYLIKVTDTPVWFFFVVSIIPKCMWKRVLNHSEGLFCKILCWIYLCLMGIEADEGRLVK